MSVFVKFALAQVGSKSGRKISVPMLLEAKELPWPELKAYKVRTFRAAAIGMVDELDIRAKQQGSVWAAALFARVVNSEELLVRIMPMASISDARSWVDTLNARVASDEHSFSVQLNGETMVHLASLKLENYQALTYQVNDASSKLHRHVKSVAASIGNIVFVVRCVGNVDSWSWEDVLTVVSLQSAKIQALGGHQNSQDA